MAILDNLKRLAVWINYGVSIQLSCPLPLPLVSAIEVA